MSAASKALIDVREMTIYTPSGRCLIEGLKLTLCAGEVLVVRAPSGTGKSTLLRALVYPELLEESGYTIEGRRALAGTATLVSQSGARLDFATVDQNIRLGQCHARAPRTVNDAKARAGLSGLRGDHAGGLSGGQQRMLGLARALAFNPEIVLMDEPAAGLDPARVERLSRTIRQIADDGAGVVVVTHRRDFAQRIADRTVELCPAPEGERTARRPVGFVASCSEVFAAAWLDAPAALRHPAWAHRLVVRRAWREALLGRQALFFFGVAALLGISVTMVLTRTGGGLLDAEVVLQLLRQRHIKVLTPPLGAILFAATSASATCAWLGTLERTGQVEVLHTLGMRRESYLWSPLVWTLTLSGWLAIGLFGLGMMAGGWLWLALSGTVSEPLSSALIGFWPVLSVDRATWARMGLCWAIYAPLVAVLAVAAGRGPHSDAASVTGAMIRAVVWSSAIIAAIEAATALLFLQ